jgi:hypothetical protein
MAQTIKLKRSSVAGNIPSSSDLALGEIAVNTADGALYIKKGDNTIVAVGDNDILHIDTSNGRVGVGTTSPSADLTVSGTIANDAFTIPNSIGSSGQVLKAPTSGTTLTWADESGSSGAIAPSINTMTGDGSTTTLALSTTPVNENATIITFDGVLQHKSTYSLSGSTITFSTAPANGVAVECIVINTHSIQALEDGDSDTKIQVEETADEDKIRFDTAGTERMIIDASGNVGIGTSSPDSKLQIMNNDGSSYRFGFSGSSDVYLDADNVYFRTDNGGANTAVMTTSGLGIGTTSPTSKVDIRGPNGAVQSRGQLYLTNTDSAAINNGSQISLGGTYSGTSDTFFASIAGRKENSTVGNFQGYLQFATRQTSGNVERMRIDSSGNVGIGTDSPAGNGNLNVHAHSTSTITSLKLSNSTSGAGSSQGFDLVSNANTAYVWNRQNDSMIFGTNNTERMRIDSSGNVGIGVTDPDQKLEVNGNIRIPSTGKIVFGSAGASPGDYLELNDVGSSGSLLKLVQDGVTRFAIQGVTGNVGIGTSSPTQKLQVNGNIKLETTGSEYVFAAATASNSVDAGHRYHSTEEYVATFTGATERMRIDSSGNVGIGTSSPSSILHTNNTADAPNGITIQNSSASGSADSYVQFKTSSADVIMGIDATGTDVFKISNSTALGTSDVLTIDSSGNLLVGKTSSSIAVAGHIIEPIGRTWSSVDGGYVAGFNRLTSDGEILNFRKDGTTVGSIGAFGGSAYIGGYQNAGLYFNGTSDIRPWNTSTQAKLDNSVDLGNSLARFKDLHLSGTANADKVLVSKDGTDHIEVVDASSGQVTNLTTGNTVGYISVDPSNSVAGSKFGVYVDGSEYLEVSSTGIDVTGNIVVSRYS